MGVVTQESIHPQDRRLLPVTTEWTYYRELRTARGLRRRSLFKNGVYLPGHI